MRSIPRSIANTRSLPNRSDIRPGQPAGSNIVLIEDDAVVALALEEALREAGAAQVRICSTTDQALAALRDHKPDILIVDVHLRDRDDGWAIAELVDDIGPKPPRIIFSTGDPEAIPRQISALGTILKKPYDPADLIALLQSDKSVGLMSRFFKKADRRRPS